jgi:catechol-2,3-dioxygenase
MRFSEVRLRAPATLLADLARFYADRLGVTGVEHEASEVVVPIGETRVVFGADADADEPFYHFALLAPGDRFEAAHAWAREVVDVLPNAASGATVFDFAFWSAEAFYFHDPAGNIVEVIAHRSLEASDRTGPFAVTELLGLSELGLAGNTASTASVLERELGLSVWDGTISELAFVGEKGRTLILSAAGRPWLPTGRPAETHPVEAVLHGVAGEASVPELGFRIRGAAD